MIVYSAHEVALKSFTYIKVIFPQDQSLRNENSFKSFLLIA